MTENMAARGEGLAGLVARVISAGDDLRYDEYGVMEMPTGHLATKWDTAKRELETALEAAAPAGTEKEDSPVAKVRDRLWEEARRGPEYGYLGNLADTLNAALATPSPQAPPEQESSNAFSPTSAREQSAATASAIPSVGDEYNLRVYKVEGHWYVDIDTEKPHSGLANGATPELAMDSAKEMLTHMRDCEVKDGRRTCE